MPTAAFDFCPGFIISRCMGEVCICVCVRERVRESEREKAPSLKRKALDVIIQG